MKYDNKIALPLHIDNKYRIIAQVSSSSFYCSILLDKGSLTLIELFISIYVVIFHIRLKYIYLLVLKSFKLD